MQAQLGRREKGGKEAMSVVVQEAAEALSSSTWAKRWLQEQLEAWGRRSCVSRQRGACSACQPMEPVWLQLLLQSVWYHFQNNHKYDGVCCCCSLELPLQITRDCFGPVSRNLLMGMWVRCFSLPGHTWRGSAIQHRPAYPKSPLLICSAHQHTGDTLVQRA